MTELAARFGVPLSTTQREVQRLVTVDAHRSAARILEAAERLLPSLSSF